MRALGTTEALDVTEFDFIGDTVQEVKEHAGHDLQVRSHHFINIDGYALVLVCTNCCQVWQTHLKPYTLNSTVLGRVALQHEMLALFRGPMECECFGGKEVQLLAEFVTQQLAAAGPEGLALNELIRVLITNDMAPAANVCQAVDDLAFDAQDGILRLPAGHPLREW